VYTASELEVGLALSLRRTSDQPDGGVIATDEGVTEMEATSTSFAATPEGFVIVAVPVVVAAEAAERNAGVTRPQLPKPLLGRRSVPGPGRRFRG
jgi:hypothetical protein